MLYFCYTYVIHTRHGYGCDEGAPSVSAYNAYARHVNNVPGMIHHGKQKKCSVISASFQHYKNVLFEKKGTAYPSWKVKVYFRPFVLVEVRSINKTTVPD